jgi:hypothetical protein
MKEIVIVCQSYPQISLALCVVIQNYDKLPITIFVVGNENLYRFFQTVNRKHFQSQLNVINIPHYPRRMSRKKGIIKNLLYAVPDIFGERRYIKKVYARHFARIREAQVYFFSRYFTDYAFYLLNRLDRNNQLVLIPATAFDALPIRIAAPASIMEWALLIAMKMIFGREIALGKIEDRVYHRFASMPDKFVVERVTQVFGKDEREELLRGFNLSQFGIFDASQYRVIYFDRNLLESSSVPSVSGLEKEFTDIFNVVTKHFPPEQIARKYKPGRSDTEDKAMIRVGDILDDYIPAELLYNDKVKVYLGITSHALANVEQGVAVSLAYLITFKDEKRRDQSVNTMIQRSHSRILFPKTLDELDQILADIR